MHNGLKSQEAAGVRFLQRAGDPHGEPAVFLPAGGWTGVQGLAVAKALAHFSWYLLDLPGTGGSQPLGNATAPAFAQWLSASARRPGSKASILSAIPSGATSPWRPPRRRFYRFARFSSLTGASIPLPSPRRWAQWPIWCQQSAGSTAYSVAGSSHAGRVRQPL